MTYETIIEKEVYSVDAYVRLWMDSVLSLTMETSLIDKKISDRGLLSVETAIGTHSCEDYQSILTAD